LNTLIVDDERLARQEMRRLLQVHPAIRIVGEAANADEAEALIDSLQPQLIFLDMQMPGRSGLQLLESLTIVPRVIFATAFDAYALKAFEVNALDYLVKPIDPARLAQAVEKALIIQPAPARPERIFVQEGERCWLVEPKDLYLLESEGNYTRLCFHNEKALLLRSLSALEARLDPSQFFRASRQQILNLNWIARLSPDVSDGLIATLKNGREIPISRRRAALLKQALSL
jgi:two-component system, LytTR family, response regulator